MPKPRFMLVWLNISTRWRLPSGTTFRGARTRGLSGGWAEERWRPSNTGKIAASTAMLMAVLALYNRVRRGRGGRRRSRSGASRTSVCVSQTLPSCRTKTIDVFIHEPEWAGEAVRACAYHIGSGFADPLKSPSAVSNPCELAESAGAAINDLQVLVDDDGYGQFQLDPLPPDETHALGTRPAGLYALAVEGPGSGSGPSTRLQSVYFGVVDLEQ